MALKTSILSLEEQAKTGFTHKSVITYSDIATAGGAATAATMSLLPYTAGTAFQAAAYKIVGTGFVGPHQVRYALERGHQVTIFNRGRSAPGMFGKDVEELAGDRATNLNAMAVAQRD